MRGRLLALVLACLPMVPVPAQEPFALGADLSFLKQQEDAGRRFRDSGQAKPALDIFKSHGWSWVRLRVFHTPANGPYRLPNDPAYTLELARQAKSRGMKLLLDFHYSDTWADPGAQSKPRAWEGLALPALADSVEAHTRSVLSAFRREGLMPEMVQIGNEINAGMLWPEGRSGDWRSFGNLLKAGIRGLDSAARGATRPRVMLHVACGGDTAATKWFFDNALAQGVPFDVIGQSYYPLWHGTLDHLRANTRFMARAYPKDFILVETAFTPFPDGSSPFPLDDSGQVRFLREVAAIVRSAPGGRGRGVFWWEPTGEAYLGTPRGLFSRSLDARPALKALSDLPLGARVRLPSAATTHPLRLITPDGRRLAPETLPYRLGIRAQILKQPKPR